MKKMNETNPESILWREPHFEELVAIAVCFAPGGRLDLNPFARRAGSISGCPPLLEAIKSKAGASYRI